MAAAPANLYRNYKTYFAGMFVRLEYADRGFGSQTKKSLTEMGRRLSEGSFIVFMLIFEARVQGKKTCRRMVPRIASIM